MFQTTSAMFDRRLLTTLTLLLCFSLNVQGQGVHELIATENDAAPDGNGAVEFLGPPVLNNNGEAAFWFLLKNTNNTFDDDQGVFRASATPGSLTIIAREGQAAPGGGLFGVFELIGTVGAINDNGVVAFRTNLTGTANDDGIFSGSGGAVTEIARLNDPAPGGGTFGSFEAPFPSRGGLGIGSAGNVNFFANNGAADFVYDNTGGTLTRNTDMIDTFWALHPSGHAAYREDGADKVFHANGGVQTQIVQLTQAAPDGNGQFQDLLDVAVNGSGQVAFASFMDNLAVANVGDKGVFRGSGGAITQILRSGQPAPVGSGVIDDFGDSQVSINAFGQVATGVFLRATAGGNSDNHAILRGSGGPLTQIAREGQPAPDGNGEFSDFTLGLENSGYHAPTINALGWVAFLGQLRNTAGGIDDDLGLYVGDGFDIVQVVREGDLFSNGANVLNNSVTFVSIPNEGRSGFNDQGQVAYRVQTDDVDLSTHVALWTPPDAEWTGGSGVWSDINHWSQGVFPKSLFHTTLNPTGGAVVSGDFGNEHVRSLTIGGGADPVTFNMQAGSVLTVVDGILAVLDNGVLTGSGTVEGALANPDGEVLVAGGQQLTFTGSGNDNDSRVTLTGGELRFVQDFTNTGTVIGNGTLRADGGTSNNGTLAFSAVSNVVGELLNDTGALIVTAGGTTTFQDDVTNMGEIRTTGGSFSVFFGNVDMNSNFTDNGVVVFQGGVSPGLSPGEVSFGGDVQFGPAATVKMELAGLAPGSEHDQINISNQASLAGTLDIQVIDEFELDIVPFDTFDIMTWGSNPNNSEFDTVAFTPPVSIPGLSFDLDYDTDGLTLEATALGGDANLDGVVDLTDLTILAINFETTPSSRRWRQADFNNDDETNLTDLTILAINFGASVNGGVFLPGPGAEVDVLAAAVGLNLNAVPEPASLLALLAFGVTPLLTRRR